MKNIVALFAIVAAFFAASSPALSQNTTTCVATTQELICCVDNPQLGQKVYNQSTQTYWVYCKNGHWADEGKTEGVRSWESYSICLDNIVIPMDHYKDYNVLNSEKNGITNHDHVIITLVGGVKGLVPSWWIEDGTLRLQLDNISDHDIALKDAKINILIERFE